MNAKQTIPVIAKIAPPLLFGVAIYYGLKWLLSADGAKKKPAVIPPPSVKIPSPAPMPTAVAIPKIVAQAPPPPPIKRKFVTREDMATAFHCGARTLTRTTAVAALKNLGFGKTAAYEALLEDGRFASLLQCASDGIITWKG